MTKITSVDQDEFDVYLVKKNEDAPARGKAKSDTVALSVRMPQDFHRALKAQAIFAGTTPEKIALAAFEKFLIDSVKE